MTMFITSRIKLILAKIILCTIKKINSITKNKWLGKLESRSFMLILRSTDIFKWRVEYLRRQGAIIGDECKLFSIDVNSEPLLIKIGDHVVISDATRFITHDGGVWVLGDKHPEIDNYGKITIGDNVFIGMNSIILPNTTIGNNCVIGAGSVLRGNIPDDSVVMGNPARVVMKTSLYKKMILSSKKTLPTALIPLDKEGLEKRYQIIRKSFDLVVE
jgi:acetyltransferase-like isoleucine patch superfamily enzyme